MRLRIALATATLGVLALVGLSACGGGTPQDLLSPEASALSAMGFSTDDLTLSATGDDGVIGQVADPSASPSPKAGNGGNGAGRRKRWARMTIRHALARNVEHGEVVVDTKDGTKTIDVQRGTVTAITDTTITVRSADGFSQTWTFGSPLHVIEHRTSIQPSQLSTGAFVGVAGVKNGSTVTANLVVIPDRQPGS